MIIQVMGLYSPRHGSLLGIMADMLRYDDGEIVEVLHDAPVLGQHHHRFTVKVKVKTYSPERWVTFGLQTKELKGE